MFVEIQNGMLLNILYIKEIHKLDNYAIQFQEKEKDGCTPVYVKSFETELERDLFYEEIKRKMGVE